MDYWAKDIYIWGIFAAEVYPRSSIAIQRTVRMSWISCPLNDLQMGQQESMGLCITSIVRTPTDSHTLDDRNHQGHHTTLLLSDTLLSTAQSSLCVGEVRSLESTGSPWGEFWLQVSTCILTGYRLNKSLHLMTWESEWSCASGFATRLTLCQTFFWQCLVFGRGTFSVVRSREL